MTDQDRDESSTTIALVADVHHCAEHPSGGNASALDLLRGFETFVRERRPAIIIDLGDRITDHSCERDALLMSELAAAFQRFAAPVHHLCGNHDVLNLSVQDNERILGQSLQSEALDLGDWRIVLWRANTKLDSRSCFSLGAVDLEWLEATLTSSNRPLLVASHVPVSGQSQISNYYFDRDPDGATYPEAADVRRVLRSVQQPVIWISGHVHWNSLTFVDGVPHLTQQSLTERFTTWPEPAGAFGLLTLGAAVAWRVFGRDPIEVRLKTTGAAQRWPPPLS